MGKRPLPPWMSPIHPFFTSQQRGTTQGNDSESHKKYNTTAWVKYRTRSLASPQHMHCACGCGRLSRVMDHIIPVNMGGSFWDTRNHQGLAKICHDRKSGSEAHGKVEAWIETDTGRIPARFAHLPAVMGNQMSIVKGKAQT